MHWGCLKNHFIICIGGAKKITVSGLLRYAINLVILSYTLGGGGKKIIVSGLLRYAINLVILSYALGGVSGHFILCIGVVKECN